MGSLQGFGERKLVHLGWAVAGAIVGWLVNVPGFFLGGLLWPAAGAVVGLAVSLVPAIERPVTDLAQRHADVLVRHVLWIAVTGLGLIMIAGTSVTLVDTIATVVVVSALAIGYFVEANAFADLAPRSFPAFAAVAGALVGAVVGLLANSGGWFLGGPLWPLGGAVAGAVVGVLFWADPRFWRYVSTVEGVVAGVVVGALATTLVGGLADIFGIVSVNVAWLIVGAIGGVVPGGMVGYRSWSQRPPPVERARQYAERLRAPIFVAPVLIFVGFTLIIPTLRTIYLSFRSNNTEDAVGTKNYRDLFGDSTIFTLDGLGDVWTSKLFIAGAVISGVALGWVLLRGAVTRRGVDLTAPLPTVSLTGSGILVMLALMGALTGVLWNNFFWIVLATGFCTIIGLAIAVLADRAKGENIAKSLVFMPMAISFVGASVIWRFVYAWTPTDPIGVLNGVWTAQGGEQQNWILTPPWNDLWLIVIMIWIQTGFAMVVLSAAIKGVPSELMEAARVDGASEGQTFWRITLPQIRATLAVVITTLIVTVLKIYDIVRVMTNGENDTNVVANRMFTELFTNRDTGMASALAVLLLAAVVPLMIVNVRRLRRAEEVAR